MGQGTILRNIKNKAKDGTTEAVTVPSVERYLDRDIFMMTDAHFSDTVPYTMA